MQSHEVDYEILGDDMQIVEIELDPGETVIAEAGGKVTSPYRSPRTSLTFPSIASAQIS